jgi:SMC interacting uncharacterized protein involved in chromosome segregation
MKLDNLLELQEKIEKGKSKISELKGELRTYEDRLLKEYNCKSIEEAQELVTKIDRELLEITKTIEIKIIELKKEYPLLFD